MHPPSHRTTGDRHGRQRLIVSGAIVAGLATIATATATSLGMVIAFRALAGLGEAAVFVGAASAAQDLATDERRGEAASFLACDLQLVVPRATARRVDL